MNIETVLRYKVIMYLHWIASEDIETQQKGVVLICWPSLESDYTTGLSGGGCREREVNASSSNTEQTSIWDKYFTPDKKEIVENKGYDVSLSYHKKSFLTPIRFSSVHFCGQNIPALRLISSIFYFGLPNNIDLKSRYKSHFGEPIELRYQLQGYGKLLHINLFAICCCWAETCFVFVVVLIKYFRFFFRYHLKSCTIAFVFEYRHSC